jgi:hypothetical protein
VELVNFEHLEKENQLKNTFLKSVLFRRRHKHRKRPTSNIIRDLYCQ